MRPRPILTVLVVLLLTIPLTGCFYSREIAGTRKAIERQYPGAEFDREVVVSVGPLSMRALGFIARLVPEDEAQMVASYLREISRVKVGVYNTTYLPALDAFDPLDLPRFERAGWEVGVKVRDEHEAMWLLYRERRGVMRDLYLVVLNEDELVLTRVRGHLNRLFERAMADHAHLLDLRVGDLGDW